MPERRTHDYVRHGVTSRFAALNIADGSVITEIRRRHRAVEYRQFLAAIDKGVPAELDVHIVCDNLPTRKTPAVRAWLARHPRFHIHFTPTGSSWINQVERWFSYLTTDLLQRGVQLRAKTGWATPAAAISRARLPAGWGRDRVQLVWSARCGQRQVVSAMWSAPCGQRHVVSAMWSAPLRKYVGAATGILGFGPRLPHDSCHDRESCGFESRTTSAGSRKKP